MKRFLALLRRWLPWLAGAFLLLVLAAYVLRQPLTGAAISTGLKMAGAGGVKFDVTDASPWRVVLENVGFNFKTQQFGAKRVTFGRVHWWQPSLGAVAIEGGLVPLTLDGSDVNPWLWTSYDGTGKSSTALKPLSVPAERISFDGTLQLKASAGEQPVTLKFVAWQQDGTLWSANAELTGRDLAAKASGTYDFAGKKLAFQVTDVAVGLETWQGFIQSMWVIPGGPWRLAGQVTGTMKGSYADKNFAATAVLKINDGAVRHAERTIAIEGITAEFNLTDVTKPASSPGPLQIRRLVVNSFLAEDFDAEIEVISAEALAVSRIKLQTLGGTLSAEPFKLYPTQREIEATVTAENLDIEKIMALTKDVPAQASGRVDGRLPIRIDENGFRFGTGYLELKKGVRAEVQFTSAGLLTGGMAPKGTTYSALKRIELGLASLSLTELRLDVRPPNAPAGRTAILHLTGDTLDPGAKIPPVVLDLNVNGPVEELLNFGLHNRMSIGVGK